MLDKLNIHFDPNGFLEMLPYMAKGMLAIFVVIGIIVLTTVVIGLVFNKKK